MKPGRSGEDLIRPLRATFPRGEGKTAGAPRELVRQKKHKRAELPGKVAKGRRTAAKEDNPRAEPGLCDLRRICPGGRPDGQNEMVPERITGHPFA